MHLSIVAEQLRLYNYAYAQLAMEFVVLEQAFAIAVIVLQKNELVVALPESVAEFDGCVVALAPAAALHQGDSGVETAIGAEELQPHLIKSAVIEDVAVVFAVNDWYPYFAVYHKHGVYHHVGAQGYFVPRARGVAIATVAFVLGHQRHFADITVLDKQRLGKSDTGIEVEVGHGQRLLQNVPEYFLRIKQVQISA